MGKIAAVDFGTKRIGLAVSDKDRKIAFPAGAVEGGKKAVQNIKNFLPIQEIELILIGHPLEMSGARGAMAERVEIFAKQFQEAVEIPILLVDERLSSKGAEAEMNHFLLKKKKKKENVDAIAAALLLQTYLDRQLC